MLSKGPDLLSSRTVSLFRLAGSFDHLVTSPLTSPITDSGVSISSEGRPPVAPFSNRRGLRGSGASQLQQQQQQQQQHQQSAASPHRGGTEEGGGGEEGDASTVVRFDKLDPSEVKDLLICFLYVVKGVEDEALVGWWEQATEFQVLDFFAVLEICLYQFRYRGRKNILAALAAGSGGGGGGDSSHSLSLSLRGDSNGSSPTKASTLPSRTPNPLTTAADAQRHAYYASGNFGQPKGGSDQLPKGTYRSSFGFLPSI